MRTNNAQGRLICIAVSGFMLVKCILNSAIGGGFDAGDFWIAGAYTNNIELAQEWKKEVEEAFPGHEMHMDPLSLSVGCHIGPGALAVTVTRKLHF